MTVILAVIGTVFWFVFWWMVADFTVFAIQTIVKHVRKWRKLWKRRH